MNVVPVYRSITAHSGPFDVTPVDPIRFPVRLPGPFILGLQAYSAAFADIALRILQAPGSQLFPDPLGKVMDGARLLAVDGWYTPIGSSWIDLRVVVDGPPYEVVFEIGNKSAANADLWVNLLCAAQPPDAVTWELLREMRQGLDRLPFRMRELMGEVVASALERQNLPGAH